MSLKTRIQKIENRYRPPDTMQVHLLFGMSDTIKTIRIQSTGETFRRLPGEKAVDFRHRAQCSFTPPLTGPLLEMTDEF